MGERDADRPRSGLWSLLWAVSASTSLAGLVFGVVIIGGFWPFGDGWYPALLLPLIFIPLLVVVFTASQRPGRAHSAFALLACAGVVCLGVAATGALAWGNAHDWIGDRCCETALSVPYATWEALMLVYATLGVVLLVLLLAALHYARQRRDERNTPSAETETAAP